MYRNSKQAILFPLLLAAGVAAGLLLGHYLGRNTTASQLKGVLDRMTLPTNKLTYTLSLIENEYVDSVSMDSLSEHVIPLLVRELDPHSVYIPASEMAELNEPLEGEFDGIGVVFNMATDTVIVLNVIPQGPSDKAGVKAGDRIIEIDDSLVAGRQIPQNRIVRLLRGPRDSKVRLGIERQGISGLVDFEVVRGVIPIKSVESAFRIVDSIGYIKLGQFARTTHEEIRQALARLRAEGVTKLIFDLRGNSGGFLDQAIGVANEFLHDGQLIVYTEDRQHRQLREYADGTGSAREMEVAVLIDEGSASSSEILAGALQDNDRGTIVGRRSFGKGLVQRQIPYSDGSALRLTTARYYTPTGRSIQKPYTIGDDESYEEELINRYRNNEFFSADSIHFADSLKRVTPGGKVVYGGGGIMPDVFVPADTTDVTRYFIEVVGRNILYRYTIEYADRHREALNAVQTLDELEALLDSDRTLVDDFIRYAARKGVAPRYGDIARSRKLIEAQLRAYIGRNTALEDNGFYANIYPVDNVIMRAIGILKGEEASHD
ncbi:S41 family peptidase [uncultured Alistipes sp.]|uniref:S41 family peptidase n=1 Tax=uncultured Alistipes sp. TaxID=538949 RepID=UPI001F889210|nr:S41 family peptidase [uncultured Alistipes sp.]HIY14922.1 S41 family peptidase [Candidatus Alistipes cottocaccae]